MVWLTVFAREEGLSFNHFRKDAACTPNIDSHVVFSIVEKESRKGEGGGHGQRLRKRSGDFVGKVGNHLLPSEHNFGCSVVAGADVAGHLGVLETGEAKVANLEIAVLIDQDVGGFEVSVDNTS